MLNRTLLAAFAGCFCLSVSAAMAQDAVPGEYLVGFADAPSENSVRAWSAQTNAFVQAYEPTLRIAKVSVPSIMSPRACMAALRADRRVQWVEPNWILHSTHTNAVVNVNDQYFVGAQYGPQLAKVPEAWALFRPLGKIIVAVIDSGVDLKHPDLAKGIASSNGAVLGKNFVNPKIDPIDDFGHGTFCAGIVGAQANNGIGVAGVAGYSPNANPAVTIMPIKVLGNDGRGANSTISTAIVWAADHGANIISMSFGSDSNSDTLRRAVNYAWSKGCVLVAAAGNNSSSRAFYPAAFDHVISVASSDQGDQLSTFSEYGSWVKVAAPGDGIFSTLMGGDYGWASGTSMAAPFVAGEAAMLWANQPTATNETIFARVLQNTDPVNVVIGRTVLTGRVNVMKAIQDTTVASQYPVIEKVSFDSATIKPGSKGTVTVTFKGYTPGTAYSIGIKSSSRDFTVPSSLNTPVYGKSLSIPYSCKAGRTRYNIEVKLTLRGQTTSGVSLVVPVTTDTKKRGQE